MRIFASDAVPLGTLAGAGSSAFGTTLEPPKSHTPHQNRLPIISNVKHPAWRCLSRGTVVVRAVALSRFHPTNLAPCNLPDPFFAQAHVPTLHLFTHAHTSWRPLERDWRLQDVNSSIVAGLLPMPSTPLAPWLLRSAHSWLVHLFSVFPGLACFGASWLSSKVPLRPDSTLYRVSRS